jgi:selenide,water dikinase
MAIVQTVDFFPPLVNDPFIFGQIAAANSLSDVYAMGATPITALNISGFPDKDLPADILVEILKGGSERTTAAGAVIIGGHSVRDSEIKYGLAVTGTVHPARIVANAGAQPGDRLVLTKPLGTGVLTSAVKAGKMPEADLAEAVDAMVDLNRQAAEAMLSVGVNAATDITGFGLTGHAYEIAAASGVTIIIDAKAVPLMAGTMKFAEEGVVTRTHKTTLGHIGNRFAADGVDETLVKVLSDAQTSGGLLISVKESRCDELVSTLRENGTKCAAVVGRVKAASDKSIILK